MGSVDRWFYNLRLFFFFVYSIHSIYFFRLIEQLKMKAVRLPLKLSGGSTIVLKTNSTSPRSSWQKANKPGQRNSFTAADAAQAADTTMASSGNGTAAGTTNSAAPSVATNGKGVVKQQLQSKRRLVQKKLNRLLATVYVFF